MKKIDKKALWEATKEPLRILVLAVIPFVLSYLGAFSATWAIWLTIALKFLDKYLHVRYDEKGLTRF